MLVLAICRVLNFQAEEEVALLNTIGVDQKFEGFRALLAPQEHNQRPTSALEDRIRVLENTVGKLASILASSDIELTVKFIPNRENS